MTHLKTIFFFTLFFCIINTFAQNDSEKIKNAKETIKLALKNKTKHNVLSKNFLIIKDSTTAINIVEPILFSIYGKENILRQKPYETILVDNYWLINGSLPKGSKGGTFEIIINALDCKVILLTHGK